MDTVINIQKLTKIYGKGSKSVRALNGIYLQIEPGMFGLLGPNGAGKTSLMRILAGILQPSGGKVTIAGQDISTEAGKQAVKAQLGYLPQELGMYPDLSAFQFVDYMAVLKGMNDSRQRQSAVQNVLETVGLADVAGRKIKSFSGGMKRRVGIAQALVNDPHILIVDEPTAGLDPEERIRFRNLLVGLATDRVVILSTHIVEDIGQTCRKMAVLARGEMLFNGSPAELVQAARGKVWSVTTNQIEKPDGGLTVVSMLHLSEGVQYRLVGAQTPQYPGAQPVEPGLEDGYVWLMKSAELAV